MREQHQLLVCCKCGNSVNTDIMQMRGGELGGQYYCTVHFKEVVPKETSDAPKMNHEAPTITNQQLSL